mgnify:CR=1 FL=1
MIFKGSIFRYFWLAVILFLAGYSLMNFKAESNLLQLLPQYQNPTTNDMVEQASAKLNNQLVIMVAGSDQQSLQSYFEQLITEFKQQGFHQTIHWQVDFEQITQLYKFVLSNYQNLLPITDQGFDHDPSAAAYMVAKAQEQLYGFQGLSAEQIKADPLFVSPRIIQSLQNFKQLSFDVADGLYKVQKNGLIYLTAFVTLKPQTGQTEFQNQIEQFLTAAQQRLRSYEVELYAFGAVRYTQHAFQQAKLEISTVGVGSMIGICLLFLWVFRSLTPLLISLMNISLGLLVAYAITAWVFTEVHMFALIFGATIAGVSVDYCFHYFVEHGQYGGKTIPVIRSALITGFLSSALVYLAFLFTGYQVLAQIAMFSVAGLLVVLVNVLLMFPMIYRGDDLLKWHQSRLVQLIYQNPIQQLLRPTPAILLVIGLSLTAYYWIKPNDDIRALQSLSPALKAEEQVIRDVLALKPSAQFILITDKDIHQLLAKEAQVLTQLRQTRPSVIGVSDLVPAPAQQRQNNQFYQQVYQSRVFKDYLQSLDMAYWQPSDDFQVIPSTAINRPPLKALLSGRWIGRVNGVYALMIPFDGSQTDFGLAGVTVVNQAGDISQLLAQYRVKTTRVLVLAVIGLMGALAVFKYGLRRAVHVVSLPLLAGLLAYHLAYLLGYHISMFSVLSLLLILGIGLDYVIFLSENKHHKRVMLAIMLSACTTVLAFGLLALSQVAVIKSFGFMLGSGILMVLLFAPAVVFWKYKKDTLND